MSKTKNVIVKRHRYTTVAGHFTRICVHLVCPSVFLC